MLRTFLAENSDRKEWDAFINKQKNSSVFHLWGWREVISIYNNERYNLMVKDGKNIVGVLPLIFIKSLIFGKKIISMPFCEYGGPLINRKEKEALRLILKQAKKIAKEKNVEYIEFRGVPKEIVKDIEKEGFNPLGKNFTFTLDLTDGIEKIWNNLEKGRVRTGVRKAEREGVVLCEVKKEKEMESYYKIWLNTQKRHGTPTHSIKLFKTMFREFHPKNMRVFLAKYEGKDIGGIILFPQGGKVLYWSSVVLSKYRRLDSQTFLVWKAIEWSVKNGYKIFDFGRTRKDTSIYFYKKAFNAKEEPLNDYILFLGKPQELVDPDQFKFKIASKLWSKVPMPVARIIGPRIVSAIGL